MSTTVSRSEAETRELGRRLARRLAPDGILLLCGEMGSGKTVLAQGVGVGLGVPAREVQSPTFTLIHYHDGEGGRLIHIDLYRLDPAEAQALGLEEVLAQPGVKVVEWAERLPFEVPEGQVLHLRRLPGEEREIEESPPGDRGRR